jgi:mannose PTS system EIIA component
MIGILVVAHGDLGVQLISTARMIGLNSEERVHAMSIDPSDSPEYVKEELQKSIRKVNGGGGVLVLTDLFGGTPTNVSLSFLEDGKVEVVTGVNLPMMIKAINARQDHDLRTLADLVQEAGKESIFRAEDFRQQRLRRRQSSDKIA